MFASKAATSMLSAELAAGQPELALAQLALTGIIFGIKKGVQHHREKKQRKADEREAQAEEQKRQQDIAFEEEKKRQEDEYQTAEQQRRQEQERQAQEQQRIIDQRAAEAASERQQRLDQLQQARIEENKQQIIHAQSFSAGILDREEAEREVRITHPLFDENGDSMSEEEEQYWTYIPGGGDGPGPNGNPNPGGGDGPGPNGNGNGGFQGQGQPIGRRRGERNPYFDIIQEITRQIASQKNKEKKSIEKQYEEEQAQITQEPLGSDPATWSPTGKELMPGQNGGGIYKGNEQIQPNNDNPGNTTKYDTQEEAKNAVLDNQHLTQQELQAIIMGQGEAELTAEQQLQALDLIEQQLELMRSQSVQLTPGSIYSSVIKRF